MNGWIVSLILLVAALLSICLGGLVALFRDKAGLGHNGQRLPNGGHYVVLVSGFIEYIPGAHWEQFLAKQTRLREAIRR